MAKPDVLPETAPGNPPDPDRVALWASLAGDQWHPVWCLPPRGGLALRLTDTAGEPVLAVHHVVTGLTVLHVTSNGEEIRDGKAARKAILGALADLLASPVDWAKSPDEGGPEWLAAARAAVSVALARRFPPRPEWRTWRQTMRGLEHKWHKSEAAARKWLQAVPGGAWWALEHWTAPLRAARSVAPDWTDVAEGKLEGAGAPAEARPARCESVEWHAWGEVRRAAGGRVEVLRSEPVEADPCIVARVAWQLVLDEPQAPTGELPRGHRAALEAGWLRLEDVRNGEHVDAVFVPTLRGLLAVSRLILTGGVTALWKCGDDYQRAHTADLTRDAAETWRAAARDARRAGPVEYARDLYGLRARLATWLRLLACLARDREAGTRHEPPGRWGRDHFFLVGDEGGVAVVERRPAAGGWEWATYRHEPAIWWAPYSARVATRDPEYGTSLREHGRRDWALEAAAERRRTGV